MTGDRDTAFWTGGTRRGPRVGIVGTGFMGQVHALAARTAGAHIVGAVGSNPRAAADAAVRVGADRGYGDLTELLDDGALDVVHVCAPNGTHHRIARQALDAGVAVVCEKPLTTSVADAEDLVAAATARGMNGAVPFVYRFYPQVREMRARLHAGEVGRTALITGTYLQDWLADESQSNWRVDQEAGGPSRTFADIGSHWFDLLEFVLPVGVVQLSARFSTVVPRRGPIARSATAVATEDTVTVHFSTEDGVHGTFAASQVARGRDNRLELSVYGTDLSFAFDQEKADVLWRGSREGATLLARNAAALSPDAARLSRLPAGHPQGYQDCFNAFVQDAYAAIAGGDPAGLPTFRDGLRAVRLTEAVTASARAGGTWMDVSRQPHRWR